MGDFSLAGSALFAGVEKEELGPLLQKVGARERSFQRGETLLTAGERARSMGLVLAGRVTVEHHDFWGSRSVLDSLGPGKVFAEAYALLPEEPLQVSVTGAEAGRVLFLAPDKLAQDPRLLRNLLLLTAEKNLRLSRRIFHTSSKTIRGGCCPTSPSRPPGTAPGSLPSPLPGSSWRTIWRWIAAPCPTSWATWPGRACCAPGALTSPCWSNRTAKSKNEHPRGYPLGCSFCFDLGITAWSSRTR